LAAFANHCPSTNRVLVSVTDVDADLIDQVPGRLNDRRTPLGELNWVFTAITDTIAWNALPPALFQRLFRQDLLVASLFRNYLLAERIMRSCGVTPGELRGRVMFFCVGVRGWFVFF
jgi:regulator-associated protein of mTOR